MLKQSRILKTEVFLVLVFLRKKIYVCSSFLIKPFFRNMLLPSFTVCG